MKRAFTALFVPILLFGGNSVSYSLFHCRSHSVVRLSCCCPMIEHESAPLTGNAKANASCCCDVQTVTVTHVCSECRRAGGGTDSAPLASALSSATVVLDSHPSVPFLSTSPNGVGPPLTLLNRSLRI